MKTTLTNLFLLLSAVVILDTFNAGHALMLFILAGIVPGTSIALSADSALAVILGIFGLLFGRLSWALILSVNSLLFSRRNTLRPQV